MTKQKAVASPGRLTIGLKTQGPNKQKPKKKLKKGSDDLDMLELIQKQKRTISEQFDLLASQGAWDEDQIKSSSALVNSLKGLSAEERAWETMYGISNMTDEEIKAEAIRIMGDKLGLLIRQEEPNEPETNTEH